MRRTVATSPQMHSAATKNRPATRAPTLVVSKNTRATQRAAE